MRSSWDRFCTEIGRLREAGRLSEDQFEQIGRKADALHQSGTLSDAHLDRLFEAMMSPKDLAFINALAFGLAKLLNTPIGLLKNGGARDVLLSPVDQLAAESRDHLAATALLRNTPGLVSRGIVLQNPNDPPHTWYGAYEVQMLRGYRLPRLPPMIDGYPTKIVVVDSLPSVA